MGGRTLKPIKNCRACSSSRLTEFLNLGNQFLADFREDDERPPKYPLVAVMCEECKLVQLRHTTPQREMYHSNYGFKSGISDSIKRDLDDVVSQAFQYKNDPFSWLDIASNDGTLLSFVPDDIYRVGVDPVKFLCEEAKQHANLIVNDYFSRRIDTDVDSFDVITSISCFYDMPDPNAFVSDVVSVLDKKGVWIIQQNYLLTTMELAAVDNFVHEHIEYYTLLSLENLLQKYGLEVNEVNLSMVNGGSLRTVVSHAGAFPVDDSVGAQRIAEQNYGVDTIEVYKEFSKVVGTELEKLRSLVVGLKSEGSKIALIAASTRGATIWQSAGIDASLVDYAVERNTAKVGKNFSQLSIPIISEEEFRKRQPEVAIIGPWFFGAEIVAREREYIEKGGTLVLPLPKVTIVNKENVDEYVSNLSANL